MTPTRHLLRSAPRLLAASRLATLPTHLAAPALARPAAPQLSPFSTFTRSLDAARYRGGPTWQRGDVVTYDELKPLTESPDDVSCLRGGSWGLRGRKVGGYG